MPRRNAMNAILVGAVGVSALGLAVPYISFFLPPGFGQGGGGGGVIAKDALGADVTVKGWLDSHQGGARELVQGLKGDATYLILDEGKVVRGPAPLSLALAHREQDEAGKVLLRTWTE